MKEEYILRETKNEEVSFSMQPNFYENIKGYGFIRIYTRLSYYSEECKPILLDKIRGDIKKTGSKTFVTACT